MPFLIKGDHIRLALWHFWSKVVDIRLAFREKEKCTAKSRNNHCTALHEMTIVVILKFISRICFLALRLTTPRLRKQSSLGLWRWWKCYSPSGQNQISRTGLVILLLLHLRFAGIKHAYFIKIIHTKWSL